MLFDWIVVVTGLLMIGVIILGVKQGWIKVDLVFKQDVDALCGKKD